MKTSATKRYCKTLTLKKDDQLIREYIKLHAPGAGWPEITDGMKEVGIVDMEIYIKGTQLFMIMETVPDFDHDKAMDELSRKPRQNEWEALVSRYQNSSPEETAADKWQIMERIYKLGW